MSREAICEFVEKSLSHQNIPSWIWSVKLPRLATFNRGVVTCERGSNGCLIMLFFGGRFLGTEGEFESTEFPLTASGKIRKAELRFVAKELASKHLGKIMRSRKTPLGDKATDVISMM